MEDEFTVDGINGTTTMNRAAYEDYQQRLACRRAEGRYTLEEAAMMFAEETKESAATMLKKLVQAVRDGKLPVFEPGRHLYYQPNKVRDFYEEVFWEDLNTWLADNAQRITWRFPMPDELRDEMECNAAYAEAVYNGKAIDWRYWVHQMPMLSAAQASRLMSGLDPDIFENLDNRPNKNDPSRSCANAKKMQRLAETQGKQGATPAEWLEWAKSLGYRVHTGFVLAVGELLEATGAKVEAVPVMNAEAPMQGEPPAAQTETKAKRINENRAFLMSCIDQGIHADIESIWLHIRNSAAKENFLFKSASQSTATTVDGKQVQKKNLGRALGNLLNTLNNRKRQVRYE